MIKYFLMACFLILLFHCSRKGENPLPIEPVLALPDYDLEATYLEFRSDPGEDPTTSFRVGQDVWVGFAISNVGSKAVPREAFNYSLHQNETIIQRALTVRGHWPIYRGDPIAPGDQYEIRKPPPYTRRWTFTKNPGTYELKLEVLLHPDYEDPFQDNNQFIVTVEVKD